MIRRSWSPLAAAKDVMAKQMDAKAAGALIDDAIGTVAEKTALTRAIDFDKARLRHAQSGFFVDRGRVVFDTATWGAVQEY